MVLLATPRYYRFRFVLTFKHPKCSSWLYIADERLANERASLENPAVVSQWLYLKC